LNATPAGRQWFRPKHTPWRQMITKNSEENAAQIRPQIHDDEAPANYFRAWRDVAAWMPKNAMLSAERAARWISVVPSFRAKSAASLGLRERGCSRYK
jgi:2-hydroxyacyl-CoA lyase 1